jgi:hypothetical protein
MATIVTAYTTSGVLARLWRRMWIRLKHGTLSGPARIRYRAANPELREWWLAGPRGRLP